MRAWKIAAVAAALVMEAAPAHAWSLLALVKGSDGVPQFVGRSFFNDRQACFTALEPLKKMSPDAVIIQAARERALNRRPNRRV